MWQARSAQRESAESRPSWWLLYAITVLLVAAVGLVELFVGGEELRKILEALTVVAGFGLIALWLRGNRVARELQRVRRRA